MEFAGGVRLPCGSTFERLRRGMLMFGCGKLTSLLAALLVTAWAGNITFAAEPNDDFGSATVLGAGVSSVSDTLDGGTGAPDTYLGFFADDSFPLPPLAEDDDSSPLGDGLADALFGIAVNADGSIPLAVTGCCDDFDGSHSEEGDYELFVDVFDGGGMPIDSFSVTSTLMAGIVDEFDFADPAWIGGTFDAVIDNTVGVVPGTDPLDFWVFTGLTPGGSYIAEIDASDFDTILASFAPDGTLLETDDDGGVDLLSKLIVEASAAGEVHLAVTGFSDFDVLGLHPQSGDYDLSLTPTPEPTACLLMLSCVGAGILSRRRA